MIEIEHYLQELLERDVGDDLEYDQQFLALTQAIDGGEEVQYGEQIYQPPEVDWRWVAEQCEALLQRSLDLRAAVYLTRAWLMLDGLSGFQAGLSVIHFLIAKRWGNLHPQLSDEDGHDPLIRLNALAHLAAADTILNELKRLPLAGIISGEALCFLPLDEAAGTSNSGDLRDQCITRLERLAGPGEMGEFQRSLGVLQQLLDSVRKIHGSLSKRIEAVDGQPLQMLEHTLQRMLSRLQPYARVELPEVDGLPLTAAGEEQPHRGGALNGECGSRAEVLIALEAVCSYYRAFEPNSPIPLLVERAKKLVGMDFLQIIDELTPESMAGIRALAGLMATDE
jgi:type VI secretion system protein ImpA